MDAIDATAMTSSFPVNRQEKAPQPFAPFDGHRLTDLWMHPREDSGLNFASRLEEIEFAGLVCHNESPIYETSAME